MKKSLFIVAIFLLYAGSRTGRADENNSNVGTSVFNFMKIDVGARPMSMAGAFTGVANDESSLYYNPAGVVKLEGRHYMAGYHNYTFGMQSGFLGYIHPVKHKHYFYGFVHYLNYGELIRSDNAGVEEGTFSGGDILFAFGYARTIQEGVSIGITGKGIYEKIDSYSASGIAFDIGIRYERDRGRTTFGAAIQNLGTQLQAFYDGGEKESLPARFRLGASHLPKGLPILVAVDGIIPSDNDPYAAIGVEYLEIQPLYLRVGWTSFGKNYKTNSSKDNLAGFSLGFGVDYRKVHFSYAITPQAELGASHRLTITGGLDLI